MDLVLCYEDLWKKVRVYYQNMRRFNDCEIYVLKLGQVVKLMFISTSRLWDEWGISMKKNITNYMYLGYTHMGSWMSNFGARVPILEVVKTHWSYNECLSKWAWMPVLKPSLVSGVAHVTKDACSLQWETPYSTKKNPPPPFLLQVFSDFLRASKNFYEHCAPSK